MAFQGFSDDTVPFYRELHENNDRGFWQANRARYDEGIRAPMLALLDELSSAFGEAKLFRPFHDVRFSKDKRPYKENIAATVGGRYLSIGREGLYVGAGTYRMQGDELARGPTGYPRDHPRIELLKHKSVTATRSFGVPDWLTEPNALDRVAETFAELEGLASWVERHVR